MASSTVAPAVKAIMANESTERLLELWTANDRNMYSPDAFAAIREILTERGVEIPQQNAPPADPPPMPGAGMVSKGIALVLLALVGSAIAQALPGHNAWSEQVDITLSVMVFAVFVWGIVSIVIGIVKKVKNRRAGA